MMITRCFPWVVLIGMIPTVVLVGWFCEVVLIIIHLVSRHDKSIPRNDCTGIRQNILVFRLLLAGLIPIEDKEEIWIFECNK